MIVEERERTEADGGNYDVEQKLQSYLRDKYTPHALDNNTARRAAEGLLSQIAEDWCIRHNQQIPHERYRQLAKSAIDNYLDNWEGKIPGEDDRGHRFGKCNTFTE